MASGLPVNSEDTPEITATAGPRLRDVLVRGLRKKCPACGEGEMFTRWMRVARECKVCGALIAPRPGDTWGFWVLLDRLFVFVPIVLIYVGFKPANPLMRISVIGAIIGPLIYTMPHRMGLCVALDFLARSEESNPPPPRTGAGSDEPVSRESGPQVGV